MLLPYQPDALVLLQRPPSAASADARQLSYCKEAVSASDKTICADRELWLMHGFTQSARERAQSQRPEINAALEKSVAQLMQRRQACNGERNCLYDVLDEHVAMLVQRW